MALCICANAQPAPKAGAVVMTPTPVSDIAVKRYIDEIDSVSREITTDKAHRTALVTRMDVISQQLQKLRSEEGRENDKKPSLDQGIATINQTIADLEHQLEQKIVELANLTKTAANQPLPTLLEDALGSQAAVEKHRALAMQNYLLHKAKLDIQHSKDKQQHLKARKVALAQTSRMLQNNLGGFEAKVQNITESRRSLELQFTDLSAAIVQKQDRLEQLEKRLLEVKSTPQLAMFSNHRGDLHDPTTGVLQHRYAEPKAQGLLKWEGILIGAPLDQQIEAVFDGTVVFADHMQGFGDVAILDHGEGYMSLYGMADFLVVEQGQQVLVGETIGTVGGSIGDAESTLYFEIRHNANTLDPESWLSLTRISPDIEP